MPISKRPSDAQATPVAKAVLATPVCSAALRLAVVLISSMLAAQAMAQIVTYPAPAEGSVTDIAKPDAGGKAPVFLEGERIYGRSDLDTVVEGRAQMGKSDTVIRGDRLEYDQPTDMARAIGNVKVLRNGNLYEGPRMELKVDTNEGFFESPTYRFNKNDAHGQASRADFVDEDHTVVHNATYTTCKRKPGPDWLPDWVLRATSIELDNVVDEGVAHGAYLSFKGVPILPIPAISFPLTEQRKSGWLPATLGFDSVNGSEVSVPYYWNIAPNRDATITPTVMAARGIDLGTEFRYLERSYSGTVKLNSMPADKLRGQDRWGLGLLHSASVDASSLGMSGAALALNINRVSDDNYWRDFTRSSSTLTQRLLPGSALLSWARPGLSGTVQVHKWQVLQDPTAPITPPYDRLPQLTARHDRFNMGGFDASIEGDFTQFEADRTLTKQPNAQRIYGLAQISRPWIGPQGFITPKLQLHAASYQFDAMLTNGNSSASSVVPTFSLDSGLVFERDTTILGRDLLQTLEPRAFYVRTPYRDQSALPNYDTGVNDFNFATIYTENAFVGHDKIADNNLLTLGLTTRFLDAATGAQLVRLGVAQRLRLEDQLVTINNTATPAKAGFSDILLGAAINLNERWVLDSTTQYDAANGQSSRSTVGARYYPGPYRVLNVAHRFQRNQSDQADISWQWPLNDFWGDRGQELGAGRGQGEGRYYMLGRMNYSMSDGRMVDSLLGLEYDAGCWIARMVFARTQTSANSATDRLMFQMEFVGFTRLGVDPRTTLTQSISRYQNLRDSAAPSSHNSLYD